MVWQSIRYVIKPKSPGCYEVDLLFFGALSESSLLAFLCGIRRPEAHVCAVSEHCFAENGPRILVFVINWKFLRLED